MKKFTAPIPFAGSHLDQSSWVAVEPLKCRFNAFKRDMPALSSTARTKSPGPTPIHEEWIPVLYTTAANGVGIGLSVSRSIIEAHPNRLIPRETGLEP